MNGNPKPARATEDYQYSFGAHHFHPFEIQTAVRSSSTRIMQRARGMYVWDTEGNAYLDGMSGLWCTAVGYGRQELVEAAARQMSELAYYNLFFNTAHAPVIELTEKLLSLLPPRFTHVVYTNSGSEANEALIRIVRRYWDMRGRSTKKILIGRFNGYHGSTVGSASLGGMKFMHEMGDLPIPGIHHIGQPYWFGYQGALGEEEFGLQAARELEHKILELGVDKVAAFVAEPFQGAGGMIFPPACYWPEIQRICRKYEVLLCADEVVGGFGRTGEWFAHTYFGFEPDAIVLAKGLTSGYVPMGALVLAGHIGQTLAECGGLFAHGLTYQGHPVAAAVGLANLKLLDEGGIVNDVKTNSGPYLQRRLREVFADHPLIGEIQGAGAVAALQFGQARPRKQRFASETALGCACMTTAFADGLIVRAAAGRVIIAPALIATRAEIDELIDKLKRAVDRAGTSSNAP